MTLFLMSPTGRTLLVIGVVIGVLLVVFAILAVILWQVLLKLEKKVYLAFEEFAPTEKERAQVISDTIQYIQNRHIHGKEEFMEQFRESVSKIDQAQSPDELRPIKDTMDFAVLYLGKLLREKGGRPADKEGAEALDQARKKTDEAVVPYTKAAANYNAVLSMWPTKLANRCHRRPNRRKRIAQL